MILKAKSMRKKELYDKLFFFLTKNIQDGARIPCKIMYNLFDPDYSYRTFYRYLEDFESQGLIQIVKTQYEDKCGHYSYVKIIKRGE